MFFVGLAGSFMPYLLFLGMIVALTLGTKVNHNPETIALSEKTIEFQPEDQTINLSNDFYFFNQTVEKKSQQSTYSAVIPNCKDCIDFPPRGKTLGYFIAPQYSFLASYKYFGLSPPAKIS